jgi:hypothetical protein
MEVVSFDHGVHIVRARRGAVHDGAGALSWDVHVGVEGRKVLRRDRVIAVAQRAWWYVMTV